MAPPSPSCHREAPASPKRAPPLDRTSTMSSSGTDTMSSHTYENLTVLRRIKPQDLEMRPEIINVVVHQEEDELIPFPVEEEVMSGEESPPFDCNKSLMSSEPRHTM